jgi:hypothetical protein
MGLSVLFVLVIVKIVFNPSHNVLLVILDID